MPSDLDVLVDLKGAGVLRDGRWLVRGVDLSVRRGEIVTLVGPNGSGKSTTAKMAIGLMRPDEGTASRATNLRVGYVPQKLSIDWTMPLTVERLMSLTGRPAAGRAEAALEAVGIAHLSKAEVQHLSGGEFQRALLARAVARDPDILVLDEPVQGVDYSGEALLYDLIGRIRDETRCGVLLISHDLHVVMAKTDTVICLNGHVCCRGTPQKVAASPEYAELFGARAAGALAVYRHSHDHVHLPDGRVEHADRTVTDHCHPGDGHHHGDQESAAVHHHDGGTAVAQDHEPHDHPQDHAAGDRPRVHVHGHEHRHNPAGHCPPPAVAPGSAFRDGQDSRGAGHAR